MLHQKWMNDLDIKQLGFIINHCKNGHPAYYPKNLLKHYLYGYMNNIRSSLKLKKRNKQKYRSNVAYERIEKK